MTVRNADQQSKPYVFNIDVKGEKEPVPVFGIIANIQPNSQAASLSLEEWNELLKSGRVSVAPYVRAEKDFSDFRKAATGS